MFCRGFRFALRFFLPIFWVVLLVDLVWFWMTVDLPHPGPITLRVGWTTSWAIVFQPPNRFPIWNQCSIWVTINAITVFVGSSTFRGDVSTWSTGLISTHPVLFVLISIWIPLELFFWHFSACSCCFCKGCTAEDEQTDEFTGALHIPR